MLTTAQAERTLWQLEAGEARALVSLPQAAGPVFAAGDQHTVLVRPAEVHVSQRVLQTPLTPEQLPAPELRSDSTAAGGLLLRAGVLLWARHWTAGTSGFMLSQQLDRSGSGRQGQESRQASGHLILTPHSTVHSQSQRNTAMTVPLACCAIPEVKARLQGGPLQDLQGAVLTTQRKQAASAVKGQALAVALQVRCCTRQSPCSDSKGSRWLCLRSSHSLPVSWLSRSCGLAAYEA